MEFRIARAARVTGAMLERGVRQALQEAGIAEPRSAVVCYGAGYNGPDPCLNALCSTQDKLQQARTLMQQLDGGAIEIVTDPAEARRRSLTGEVFLARQTTHAKGRDITVVLEPWQVDARRATGATFFTPYYPSTTEYRVWVYRRRILAVYEKRLSEPNRCTKIGRNRANGFTFHAVEKERITAGLRDVSVRAISSLRLDFGAVDVIHTTTTAAPYRVLEVNSAPGVSDEHRTAIVKLVHRVVRWCANGCPNRATDN